MNPYNTVWLIDDDQIYLLLAELHIHNKAESATIHTFRNGSKALQELADAIDTPARLPDLILLDINMPVKDGWDFMLEYAQLKPQLQKDIPIYICSSSVYDQDLKKVAADPLVKGFLEKPVDEEKLQCIFNNVSV